MENYDHLFSGYVDRMLQEIETYDGYCRRTLLMDEERFLPELKYGKDGEQGFYQIALKCFKPHDEHYRTLMGPSSLHKLATLEAFITRFREINDQYTRQARALRQAVENARPPRKLDELYDELQVSRHQKMFVDGKRENRSELSIMGRHAQDSRSLYTVSTKLEAARVNSDGEWEIESGTSLRVRMTSRTRSSRPSTGRRLGLFLARIFILMPGDLTQVQRCHQQV